MRPTRTAAVSYVAAIGLFGVLLARIAVGQATPQPVEAGTAPPHEVAALYPEHEIERFADLFFHRIQHWRDQKGGRPASPATGLLAASPLPPA